MPNIITMHYYLGGKWFQHHYHLGTIRETAESLAELAWAKFAGEGDAIILKQDNQIIWQRGDLPQEVTQ